MALGVKMQLINKKELEKEYSSYLDSLSKKYKLDVKINSTINEQMKQTEQQTRKTTQAQNKQNVSLQELNHLRKTQQIDAQQYIQLASKYRQQEEFVNLTKKEQVQLVQMLTKAEKEHSGVLNVKTNVVNTINKQNEAEKQVNATIQKQIAEYKDLFAIKNQNLKTTYGKSYNETEMSSIAKRVNNLNASDYTSLKQVSDVTKAIDIQTAKATAGMNEVRKATTRVMKESDRFATTFVKDLGKLAIWSAAAALLYAPLRSLREGINTVVELDASLTELNKVTDISKTQMKLFTDQAYEMGVTIGRTGKDVIEATSTFAKAGFDLQESFDLSKQALILTNVGDGITDVTEAAGSIIAVLRGYQMEATNTSHVIDLLNEVSNKYAVDTNNLTDGLQRTSGTLAQTGTSVEQLTGLLTGGYESLRNMEKVSSGLITISQRLRGVTDIGEEIDGLMPKLQQGFKEIAGVDIQTTNGQLRSTFDILSDMQKVWGTLNDEQKQYLGELASGVRQAPVLNAIMQNWQSVEGATQAAINSFGSAERENAKYLDSIQGRMSKFTSSVQMMWNNAISSDFIKFVVSAGTGIVNLTDYLGLLNVVVAITITYFTVFSKSMILAPIINVATIAISGFTKSLGIAGIAALRLNTILGMFAPLALAAGIYAVVKAFDVLIVTVEEQREKVQALSDELKNLQSTKDQLLAKENRTEQEEKYLKILEKQKEALKDNLAYETKLLVRKQYGDNSSPKIADSAFTIGSEVGSIYGEESNNDIDLLKKYNEEIKNLDDNNKNSAKTYEDLKNKIAEKTESLTKEYSEIQKNIKVLDESNEQGSEEYKILTERAKAIESVILQESNLSKSTNDVNNAINSQTISFGDLAKTIIEARESISDINSALDEYKETGKFSTDTLISLIDKYPSLLQYLNDEKSLYSELVKLQNDKVTSVQDSLNSQISLLKDNLNNTFKVYQSDVDNFKNAQQAKMFIMSKLGEKILQINELIASAEYAGSPEAQYYLGNKLAALETAKAGINKQLDNFFGLKSVDIKKLVTDVSKTDKSKKDTSLSDILTKEQEYQNKVIEAENKSNNLLNEEYEARKNNLDLEEKAQKSLLAYYESQRNVAKSKGLEDELNEKILGVQGKLADIEKTRKDINQDITTSVEKQQDLYKQQKESIQEVIDLTEKMIKQQKEDEINALKEEIDAYEKIINAKKEQLKLTEEQHDYEKDISEKQKGISTIQNRLLELSLDDSRESQAERLKLEEELAKLTTDLEETQHDRSIQLQEDALDTELEQFKDTKEDEIQTIQDYLNKSGQLTADAMALINSQSDSVYANLVKWNKLYGTSVEQDISTAWDKAKSALQSYKTELGVIDVENAFNEIDEDAIVAQMQMNSLEWTSASESEKERLHAENEELAKLIGAIYKNDGHWYKGTVKLYHEGIDSGFVGGLPLLKTNEEFAKLLKGELIINPIQMNRFMTNTLPQLSSVNNKGNIQIDSLLTINGNVDNTVMPRLETIVNQAVDKLVDTMGMRGISRNIKTVSI